jgi:hypothetical protein
LKTHSGRVIGDQPLAHHFDGDLTVHLEMPRAIDSAHPALAESLLDQILLIESLTKSCIFNGFRDMHPVLQVRTE